MKKKVLGSLLALSMVAASLAACGKAAPTQEQTPSSDQTQKTESTQTSDQAAAETVAEAAFNVGVLSYLNMTEDEIAEVIEGSMGTLEYLIEAGVVTPKGEIPDEDAERPDLSCIYYDTLDAMVMGLQSGDVTGIDVPLSTAQYLVASNDDLMMIDEYDFSALEDDMFANILVSRRSSGYSFMLREDETDLRDEFNKVIDEMKEDGTLDELTKKYITEADYTNIEPVEFEKVDGDTIKVAVTGSLPPMDYVAPDGTFAGFNTALLAEIGKRTNKNIELVQVDSVGRASALASGTVDVVFWNRGMVSENLDGMTDEEAKAYIEERRAEREKSEDAPKLDQEKIDILNAMNEGLDLEEVYNQDRPDGTIFTKIYYKDINVPVVLKK